MGREKKRGTSGNAVAYISRPKALKKLQLTLDEFRRLCILKGVYPRNPRKKLDGSDKTYYLRKDIEFLAHERLITTVRNEHAHKKKVVKARAKRRIDILKKLALSTPRARLDHLVVERYPRFEDAIRELDDPLCIIALFANLPAERRIGISPYRVSNCQRLLKEFCHLVSETHALKKVFVSIKGYYYQANVCGINVTWVTPHRFTQVIPKDVDFSVMLTFLELYECILSFVNFRLYTSKNLAYPPKISRKRDANALELGSLVVEKVAPTDDISMANDFPAEEEAKNIVPLSSDAVKAAEKIIMAVTEEEEEDDENDEDPNAELEDADSNKEVDESDDDDDDEADDDEDKEDGDEVKEETSKIEKKDGLVDKPADDNEDLPTGVFSGKSIVLGREVPFVELQFTLRSAGALLVTREDDLPEGDNRLAEYTHWIIDRPAIVGDRDMSLEYVQPQYVFDSLNAVMLLPTSLYAPGSHLPPHLSPFLTAAHDGGYRPWFQGVLERIKSGDASVVAEAAAAVYAEGEAMAKKAEAKSSKSSEGAASDSDTAANDENDDVEGDTEMGENGKAKDGAKEIEDDSSSADEAQEESQGEEDIEGDEKKVEDEKREKLDKEGKEMAALMLSRKKMLKYKKVKGREDRADALKEKLTAKRQKLDEETADLTKVSVKKRKKTSSKTSSVS